MVGLGGGGQFQQGLTIYCKDCSIILLAVNLSLYQLRRELTIHNDSFMRRRLPQVIISKRSVFFVCLFVFLPCN